MRSSRSHKTFVACLGVGLLACGAATAQYQTGFEAPTFAGSPDGTVLAGQGNFYLPPGSDSVDYFVYTYADNALEIPPNPAGGGDQFVAGTGPGGSTAARGQRDMPWGSGVWTITYDAAAVWLHEPGDPAGDNLGSFSIQDHTSPPDPPASASFIHLFSWVNINYPSLGWRAFYLNYDAEDNETAAPGSRPGPEWAHLELNHWYRFSTTVDFDLNQIVEVSITDLTTGESATVNPTDWYLRGGAPGAPTPTGFRFFAGGTVPGNSVAWDNLSIVSAGACPADVDGDGDTDLGDLGALLAAYGSSLGDPNYNPAADFDSDNDVDLNDLAFLLADYGCGA
jgi:hypothetical protein